MTGFQKIAQIFLAIALLTVGFNSNQVHASIVFSDVPSNHWAKEEIEGLASQGVINGYPDGSFLPNDYITRAHAAVIIGRALNIDLSNRPNPHFVDVSTSNSAYPYIAALVDEEVFGRNEEFNPNNPLTRAQMAKILVEAFNIEGVSNKVFDDLPYHHWATTYVTKLVASNITTGISPTEFSPNGYVTRAQMAVFVIRTLDSQEKNTTKVEKSFIYDVLDLVNVERAKENIHPLELSTEVTEVAQIKAEDMRDQNYFSHTSPTYGSPFDMLKQFGVQWTSAAENIAAGQSTPEEVVTGWMNSDGHRKNILSSNYTEIGIGFTEGGSHGYYWVQMFIGK
ncbi:S-layer homology domain-containing protein [Cytobacillus sp. IB215665]|uniref:S-layer homology domain-containing protein n=1 Tax=Cytobacillus sp. IB215665 TaxID=3097357 RepID=UPI002A0D07B9|nr:S-layer homology domain-containing protein [Cytobacillus sp. IB215665]MDX8366614.1 S-layer homology domain-containing protein [Cytobacillus sp. IB215665]